MIGRLVAGAVRPAAMPAYKAAALATIGLATLVFPARAVPQPVPAGALVVGWNELPGFADDDLAAALAVFRRSCAPSPTGATAARAAPVPAGLHRACAVASRLPRRVDQGTARTFFQTQFTPVRVPQPGFFTGYFEPVVAGALTRSAAFNAPLLAAPRDLAPGPKGEPWTYRAASGAVMALPDRASLEAGALGAAAAPLVWLRDPVDVFIVQVQGSARVRLPDGSLRRVAYAGRNGYPYTSVGKLLVDELGIPPAQMGLAELRSWLRAHGTAPGEAGRTTMDRNRSYIFFRFDESRTPGEGPVGAAGVGLTPLRSLAVDHAVWAYGLPIYLDAVLPWRGSDPTPFRRLLVAQDTGSGIVGRARGDIFFGTGAEAAARAGPLRHPGTMYVLWPKDADTGEGR